MDEKETSMSCSYDMPYASKKYKPRTADGKSIDSTDNEELKKRANKSRSKLEAEEEVHRPVIILVGMQRSGKTSIKNVVFCQMQPGQTLYLEATNTLEKTNVSEHSFVKFQIWDFPGQMNLYDNMGESGGGFGRTSGRDTTSVAGGTAGGIVAGAQSEHASAIRAIFDAQIVQVDSLVFVIDAQLDDIDTPVDRLIHTIRFAHDRNPNIRFHVFIHKIDGLTNEDCLEKRRAVHSRTSEYFLMEQLDISLGIYQTTIYDYSVIEAFSKVAQASIPQATHLETMLNSFSHTMKIDKIFLFDVASKVYIAADSAPLDSNLYELCCNMIDTVLRITDIYSKEDEEHVASNFTHNLTPGALSLTHLSDRTALYLMGINHYLACVCLIRGECLEKRGLIEHNFEIVKKGVISLLKLNSKSEKKRRRKRSRQADRIGGLSSGNEDEEDNDTCTSQSPVEQFDRSTNFKSLPKFWSGVA